VSKYRIFIVIILVCALYSVFPADGIVLARSFDGTDHSGALAASETWTVANSPHTITGNLTIPAGITLTIEPGVTVKLLNTGAWQDNGKIIVNGTLSAIGTGLLPILFTSNDDTAAGQWASIFVQGGAADLDYVEVRYGGGGAICPNAYYAVLCIENGGSLHVNHASIHDNTPPDPAFNGGAVAAYSANDSELVDFSIHNTVFEDNGTANAANSYYPLFLNGPGIQVNMGSNVFTNNQVNRVLLQNNPMKTLNAAVLPYQTGLDAYVFQTSHTVPSGQTLTIEPGVKLLMSPGPWASGYTLFVEGTLLAKGTQTSHIIFDATDTAFGWGGVLVHGSNSSAMIDYAEIYHGGHAGEANQNYFNAAAADDGHINIRNSIIADSVMAANNYHSGLIYISNGSATLTNNTITNNTLNGAQFYAIRAAGANSQLEMKDNNFTGNSVNAVLLGSDGLSGTNNILRPQTGLLGYDFGMPSEADTYTLLSTGNLTIEPGTVLRGVTGTWGRGVSFIVQGKLTTDGTTSLPVVFRGVDDTTAATWAGIYIHGGKANLYATTIRGAGRGQLYPEHGPYPSLWVDTGGNLTLASSIVSENHNYQSPDTTVLVENATAVIRDTTFSQIADAGDADYPLAISGADSQLTLSGNIFDTIGLKRILLHSDTMSGADFSLVPVDGLEGYELDGKLVIPAGFTMTVQPGVKVMGRNYSSILVNGRLVAKSIPGQEIVFTSTLDNAAGQWAGLIFMGASASGDLDGVSVRCGGGSMAGYYDPLGSLVFKDLSPDAVNVRRSKISNGDTAGWQIVNSNITQSGILDGNLIFDNPDYGLMIGGASQVLISNTAIIDNVGGVYLAQSGVQAALPHTTLARNTYSGLKVVTGASASLTNSIFSQNAIGVETSDGATVTLDSTLWDNNTHATSGNGTVLDNTPYSGAAAFDPADGYHLTLFSQALNKGQNTTVATDIDGRSRPQPSDSHPDLGADEINQGLSTETTAVKLALPPIWVNMPDPFGNPFGKLLQEYWIRLLYGSDQPYDQPVSVKVRDTLPTGLNFSSEYHSPMMTFTQEGQNLNWQTSQNLLPNESVDIHITSQDSNPQAGHVYTNTAVVTAGSQVFNLSAESQVDIFAPLITWPNSGEICPLEDTSLDVTGSAQPGTTVEIYENNVKKGEAITGADGLFTVHYLNSGTGIVDPVTLTARACKDGTCSGNSTLKLIPSQSFWCPMRSTWTGTPTVGPLTGHDLRFGFRNSVGVASTNEWYIDGVYGFQNTHLTIHACNCPAYSGTTDRPESLWVIADGVTYAANSSSVFPDYQFDIAGAHTVEFWARCRHWDQEDDDWDDDGEDDHDEGEDIYIDDHGHILRDPDGYVVDSTQGFDSNNPTAHVVPGSTVTAMAYLPEWGGWVPWPAHLYNNQVNPQVVGADGYFAFFTPPGQYYLEIDPPDGYQPWRSPVVTVVNEIVHVNVPLTPITNTETYTITSTTAGFSQPILTIPVGSQVRWETSLNPQEDLNGLVIFATNPVLRLLSELDPFASVEGWDSGRLIPGENYTRQFNTPGDYTYTDSVGHTAVIHVVPVETKMIFLPIVQK